MDLSGSLASLTRTITSILSVNWMSVMTRYTEH